MTEQWLNEHWVFLVVIAALLGPTVATLISRALNKGLTLDDTYVMKADCDKHRSSCGIMQEKCTERIETVLTSIREEIRANRLAIFWIADRMEGVPKAELFELRSILERVAPMKDGK